MACIKRLTDLRFNRITTRAFNTNSNLTFDSLIATSRITIIPSIHESAQCRFFSSSSLNVASCDFFHSQLLTSRKKGVPFNLRAKRFTSATCTSCSRESLHYLYSCSTRDFQYVHIICCSAQYTKENEIVSRWSKDRSVQCLYTYRITEYRFSFLSYVHSFHEHCTCANLIVQYFLFNTASKPLSIIRFILDQCDRFRRCCAAVCLPRLYIHNIVKNIMKFYVYFQGIRLG